MKYVCTDCDWSASGADDAPADPSKRAIEHHVARGHDIERIDPLTEFPTTQSRLL